MSWLIAVEHEEKYLGQVLNRLGQEDIRGKKVMLEMYSYPMEPKIREINSSFANFWDGIARYVLDENSSIVCGEDSKLYFDACRRMNELGHKKFNLIEQMRFREQDYWEEDLENENKAIERQVEELSFQYHEVVPFVERDPHFADMYKKEKPDIIILGYRHISYLIKNCFPENDYSLTYIPTSTLHSILDRKK